MSDGIALIVGLGLLIVNAFFVGAEFAILSARHSQLAPLVEQKKPGAKLALYAVEHVSQMLACAQFGITVCSVSIGAIAEPAIAHSLEPVLKDIGVSEAFAHPVAFVIALMIAVFMHVVFGEMIPKNISISLPVGAALFLAPALVITARVLHPIIWVMNAIANAALRLMRVEPKDEVESGFTAQEVAAIVTESQREGLIDDEQGLLAGALEFSTQQAGDLMVAMDKLVTVTFEDSPADIERLVSQTGYSRFAVCNNQHQVAGYLHLKDVLDSLVADPETYEHPIQPGAVRIMVTVSVDDEIEDVLRAMQGSRSHLARVDSDSQQSLGVIFLEDILEELVGEVRDVMQRPLRRRSGQLSAS